MRQVRKRVMLSVSAMSMLRPRPVRARANSAAIAAMAASWPASMSAAGAPTFCGSLSGVPVRSMTPE
jgi:hypothetical protein